MKKLLGLLAVAPMALAACGGSEATTTAGYTPKGELVSTEYYLGHGANGSHFNAPDVGHADGPVEAKYNTHYQVIESEVYATLSTETDATADDTVLNYMINESIGYIKQDAVTGLPTGEDMSYRYVYALNTVDEANIDDLVSAITVTESDVDFVAKTDSNYGSGKFTFGTNRDKWVAMLNASFGTCEDVTAVEQSTIDALAANKSYDPINSIGGATATESGLYVAAALTDAKVFCASADADPSA